MAWSVSVLKKTVWGDQRVQILSCVADAATQAIATGLNVIEGFSIGPKSLTTGAIKLAQNVNASAVAAAGTLGASGFTSGDELYVTVYGR